MKVANQQTASTVHTIGTGLLRLPIVGVMGSGDKAHEALARPLGAWLAGIDVHLLTGGGGGTMACVAEAFCNVPGRLGRSIGILPAFSDTDRGQSKRGYPNPWIEIPVRTHLPLSGESGISTDSRNSINVLTSDVVIALPGGPGTESEIVLAVRYHRPVGLWGYDATPENLTSAHRLETMDELQAFVLFHLGR